MSDGEFSVYVFFPGDLQDCEVKFVDARTAVKTARRLTESVGGRFGMIERIIITDGGDFTVFEWKRLEGITFPSREELDACRQ